MTDEQARVLARRTNIAVTQLEGRAFPGIHVQGDTFFALLQQFIDAAGRLRHATGDREALEDLDYARRGDDPGRALLRIGARSA